MKVHELITRLQNFDMYLDVKCLGETTTWAFDDDLGCSVEIDTVTESDVQEVKLAEAYCQPSFVMIK